MEDRIRGRSLHFNVEKCIVLGEEYLKVKKMERSSAFYNRIMDLPITASTEEASWIFSVSLMFNTNLSQLPLARFRKAMIPLSPYGYNVAVMPSEKNTPAKNEASIVTNYVTVLQPQPNCLFGYHLYGRKYRAITSESLFRNICSAQFIV
ncbi:hypothetical protein CEXT_728081 [Caerostris extrusa]|uniref:Uncharacterized protein n=1 Tax=Caerostris extrusa TaxID=172846 RepID=A0AAV4QCJ0_CAEEX|nr:hypothetical protein CEXT_728081 [Caerostris extrusa]